MDLHTVGILLVLASGYTGGISYGSFPSEQACLDYGIREAQLEIREMWKRGDFPENIYYQAFTCYRKPEAPKEPSY